MPSERTLAGGAFWFHTQYIELGLGRLNGPITTLAHWLIDIDRSGSIQKTKEKKIIII